MTDKLIDIIIPAYKAHDTIFKTLASIASQTMSDAVKVTVVNDACTEGTYKPLIDKFRNDLDIVEIILNENVGPGSARQVGIDSTSCEYIIFCDADDLLAAPTAVEILYMNINRNDANVIGSSFIEQTAPGIYVPHNEDMVWVFDKIYRRSFLERFDIKFTSIRANEDTCFNRKIIIAHDQINQPLISIDFVSYIWSNRNKNSITRINNGQYRYDQNIVGFIDGMLECVDWMERKHINEDIIREQIYGCTIFLYLCHCNIAFSSRYLKEQAYDAMKDWVQSVWDKYSCNYYSVEFLKEYNSHLKDLTVNPEFNYTMLINHVNIFEWIMELNQLEN